MGNKDCQWCEKPISTMYRYDNILVIINYPSSSYNFDSKKCLYEWIKSVLGIEGN